MQLIIFKELSAHFDDVKQRQRISHEEDRIYQAIASEFYRDYDLLRSYQTESKRRMYGKKKYRYFKR